MTTQRKTRQIELQRLDGTQDEGGQPSQNWVPFRVCWAEFIEQTGREYLRGEAVEQAGKMLIHIMHPRASGEMPVVENRAVWTEGDTGQQRVANIVHVQRAGHDRRKIVLHCQEVG